MKIKFTFTASKIYDLDEIFAGKPQHEQDSSAIGSWIEDSVAGILDDPLAFIDQAGLEEKVTHEEV